MSDIDTILQEWSDWWRYAVRVNSGFLGVSSPSFYRMSGGGKSGGSYSERRFVYFDNLSKIIRELPEKQQKIIHIHYLTNALIEYKISISTYPQSTYYRLLSDAKNAIAKQLGIKAA